MAQAVDSSDLDELISDSDEITQTFMKAADHLKNLLPKLDQETLLTLYSYYKQGTDGPCNTPKPSWYEMKPRAKWNAWKSLGTMSSREAKISYCNLVEKLDPSFSKCNETNANSKEGWVTVSTLCNTDQDLREEEKSFIDFIKEGDIEKVKNAMKTLSKPLLKSVLNNVGDDGLGPVHWAADRGFAHILELLISHGADVNLIDADSQTALHYSVSCSHLQCVEVLLKNGADICIADSDGLTVENIVSDDVIKEILRDYQNN